MIVCPACQASNPDGARFCNQCGARLDPGPRPAAAERHGYTPQHLAEKVLRTRAALEGERKRVTVLFCDIKGSTHLAEQAGAERWHAMLDRFFGVLTAAVHRFEGTVNQYTGDGIMALFGAPIAHEDHASRACLAALEMQQEVRKFADELRLHEGLNLSMRVGLNTGEVIVGRIGDDLRMDYTAQGLTVNLAARMEQICEPGHIYLTRNTAMLVEGYFRLRDLGAMPVQGASQPIEVYDLEGEGAIKTRLQRGLARGGSPFIGREREMALLQAALERARGGAGQVIAVVGSAGIGKSRLCHEFAEGAGRAGLAVHRASGVPYAGALPLHPVQTLVRARLGIPEHGAPAEIKRLVAGTFLLEDAANAAVVPSVLEFLGVRSGQDRQPDQAATARERMFDLLARFLPRAEAPQLLVVEDVHFADGGTEDFLARLGREVKGTHTLLLLNYRPDYISEWLTPFLDEQIALSALSTEQILTLTRSALGRQESLRGIAERIAERANGNPYYAEEAVQALADDGYLYGDRGAYVLARPIAEWRIPDTVHALIAARIDRLPEEHKTLLQAAAVIGREFRPELLAQLAAAAPEPLEQGLGVLEDTGFVHQKAVAGAREYAFCHPLVQEVAYQAQLESRRNAAHARLAQYLEQQHPADGPVSEAWMQIAHHWKRAGDWARAGAWNLTAARWAGTHDIGNTMRQFRLAIEHLAKAPDSPDVIKQRIAARAGLIRMAQFSDVPADELERVYQEARAMAEWCCDTPSLAELLLSYAAEQLHRGDAQVAVDLATEAVHRAVEAGARELVHRFRLSVLIVHNAAGSPREGIQLVNEAAGTGWMTEPIGFENFMSRAFLGVMQLWLGHLPDAERNLRTALEFAEREDRASSWMHANLVDVAWFSGVHDNAMFHAQRALARAEAYGSPFFIALAHRSLAVAHGLRGDYADAVALLERARPWVAPGGSAHQFEANFLASLSTAYHGAGRVADAHTTAEAAIASAQRSHSRVWEIAAWLALLALPAGGPWEARVAEGVARVEALLEATGAEGFRPWWWQAKGRWAAGPAEAERCYAEMRRAFERIGARGHVHTADTTNRVT